MVNEGQKEDIGVEQFFDFFFDWTIHQLIAKIICILVNNENKWQLQPQQFLHVLAGVQNDCSAYIYRWCRKKRESQFYHNLIIHFRSAAFVFPFKHFKNNNLIYTLLNTFLTFIYYLLLLPSEKENANCSTVKYLASVEILVTTHK